MSKFNYFPIIKTREAEIKGYSNLSEKTMNTICPILELTRSRRSKKNKDGIIKKKIEKLHPVFHNRTFILDLTVSESLSNKEISEMLNNEDGYKKWCDFIMKFKSDFPLVIPVIHYNNFYLEDVKKQIETLLKEFHLVAFRLNVFPDDDEESKLIHSKVIDNLKNLIPEEDREKIILILDGSFIKRSEVPEKLNAFHDLINKNFQPKFTICASSSFPVKVPGETSGKIPMAEPLIYKNLSEEHEGIYYGDYASIHPKIYKQGGGGWVPRIDMPLEKKVYYYRRRRRDDENDSSGAYIRAAKKIIKNEMYKKIECWGDEEIHKAKNGEPSRKNPSFWISVRMNIHMTRQQKIRKNSISITN